MSTTRQNSRFDAGNSRLSQHHHEPICTPEQAIVRYPSDAAHAIDGWVYLSTLDSSTPRPLTFFFGVQVRKDGHWLTMAEARDPEM